MMMTRNDVYNMGDCIVSIEEIEEAKTVEGVTVRYCTKVDRQFKDFADCEDKEFKGVREFEEYLLNFTLDDEEVQVSAYVEA